MMDAEDSVTPNASAQQLNPEGNSQPTQDSSMPDASAKSNLEGMFDDDDDDDEFSSSAVTGPTQSSQPAPAS